MTKAISFVEQKAKDFKETTVSRHETVDGDHGRSETRVTLKHMANNLIRRAREKTRCASSA
jgi:hypothetical protein